ncbi:MAG: Bug family tripartite tricarboxylate transporter substrate binding protein [Syntrophothermus sp.]
MKALQRIPVVLLVVAALLVGFGTLALAIDYPSKPVTVIHGFKPGGGSDQLSQLVQPFLEKVLNQRFVNVYKPGADGAIAWSEVANSKPDGYTLTTCLTPKTQLNTMVNANPGYAMSDFEPIANIIFDPGILVVGPNSKFKTMKDLLDYAKKNPGQLKVSNSGIGGDDWYNALMIEKLAGVKFNNIPFEGDAPAWQAAAGGHVDANTNNLSTVTPLIKGGKLRALAVYTEKRIPMFPDVPTLKELGINFVEGSFRGYLAPKGTPKEVVNILAQGLEKVVKDPQFIKAAEDVNLEIEFIKTDDYKAFIEKKEESLRKIVEEMGLKGK